MANILCRNLVVYVMLLLNGKIYFYDFQNVVVSYIYLYANKPIERDRGLGCCLAAQPRISPVSVTGALPSPQCVLILLKPISLIVIDVKLIVKYNRMGHD